MEDSGLTSEYIEIKPVEQKTIPEYCLERSKFFADQGKEYWLVDGLTDEKRYFNKFDEETRKLASAFYKLGLRKGGVVIYMIRELSKLPILLNGVWRANGVMRATYPEDDVATILGRVKESASKFIVCEHDAVPVCMEVAQGVPWDFHVITSSRSKDSVLPSIQQFLEDDDGTACPKLQITEDDPAVILCTSGTTGLPKGAVHIHRGLLYQLRSLERASCLPNKLNLVATKATHVSGAVLPLLNMTSGKTSLVVSNVTKENIFDVAEKYKPGYVFAFATYLIAMAEAHGNGRDFGSIEVVMTGGVPITSAIREILMKLPNLKDIVLEYGLTETLLCTSSTVLLEEHEKTERGLRDLPPFSVGKVYPGTKLRFINPETLENVGENEHGEICVKTPGLFHSYLNNSEATDAAFLNGYFRTGDVGYFDNRGFVFIKDRLKDIFKYYGNHVSPTEIENLVGKHPKVSEVCVIGIPDPGGHVPRAFVRVQQNSGPKDELIRDIMEFANSKLAPYKHLQGGVYILDELPKGKTGKVSRQLLQELDVS